MFFYFANEADKNGTPNEARRPMPLCLFCTQHFICVDTSVDEYIIKSIHIKRMEQAKPKEFPSFAE